MFVGPDAATATLVDRGSSSSLSTIFHLGLTRKSGIVTMLARLRPSTGNGSMISSSPSSVFIGTTSSFFVVGGVSGGDLRSKSKSNSFTRSSILIQVLPPILYCPATVVLKEEAPGEESVGEYGTLFPTIEANAVDS